MIRRAAMVAAVSLVAACAAVPRPAPALSGRLAVRVESRDGGPSRSMSAQFELRGDANAGELQLTTPLGSIAAQARWRPGSVELVTPEGTLGFSHLDALAQHLLGESLPLAALIDWLRGRPWPGAPSVVTAAGFDQLGWHVDLARLSDGWVLAGRERLPVVSVRVQLERAE